MSCNRLRSALLEWLVYRGHIVPVVPAFPYRHWANSSLPLRLLPAIVLGLSFAGWALGQSPTQPPSQPKSQQTQTPAVPVPAKAKAGKDKAEADKVYTDEDVENLPPGGVSVIGPTAPPAGDTSAKGPAPAAPKAANQSAKAAYWKARYAAARDKLAQDEKALPVLQSQLEAERVQESSVDEDTGQVNSDLFMDLLNRIDAVKLAVENDKQALSELDEEFRKAGGLPGWIR
jgi:cytoskeletal protein RodZ